MKKISLIIGIVVLVLLTLIVIIPTSTDKRLKNINPSNFEIKYGTTNKWVDTAINAKNIKSINTTEEENQHKIVIELNSNGQQIFKEITSEHIGEQVGIFIRGKVISAPTISETIDSPFLYIVANTNEGALVLMEDILNEIPNPNAFYTTRAVGKSMEDYGSPADQDVKIYYNQECMPGDNCSFQCLVDKCVCPSGGCVNEDANNNLAIKRLVSIKNGCYWFEGNSKPWTEGNIKYESFDSRTYGCLLPSEFSVQGVVK